MRPIRIACALLVILGACKKGGACNAPLRCHQSLPESYNPLINYPVLLSIWLKFSRRVG